MNKPIRYLGMPNISHAQWLKKLQSSLYLKPEVDCYNSGELVELLETRVAKLLNKEKALFFPKGTVAQFCALKVAAENKQNNKIILHPKSHLVMDEEDAYQSLVGLKGVLLGSNDQPFSFEKVKNSKETVASLVVELPLRRAGFKLTPWTDLEAMSQWSKQQNVHFHMDGARLWESTEYYQKSPAEISDLFDSVYVSLYKGLGGIGGALLVGNSDFIAQCKVWRTRFGGDFFTSFPMLVSGLDGLDNQLNKIPEQVTRARLIANQLSEIPQLKVNQPHTNGFFIFTEADVTHLNNKAKIINQEFGLKLFNQFNPTDNPNIVMAEIQVGPEHHLITTAEIKTYFLKLVE